MACSYHHPPYHDDMSYQSSPQTISQNTMMVQGYIPYGSNQDYVVMQDPFNSCDSHHAPQHAYGHARQPYPKPKHQKNGHLRDNRRRNGADGRNDQWNGPPPTLQPQLPSQQHQQQQQHVRSKWRPCKHFAQGHCRNGNRCKFSHSQRQTGPYIPEMQPMPMIASPAVFMGPMGPAVASNTAQMATSAPMIFMRPIADTTVPTTMVSAPATAPGSMNPPADGQVLMVTPAGASTSSSSTVPFPHPENMRYWPGYEDMLRHEAATRAAAANVIPEDKSQQVDSMSVFVPPVDPVAARNGLTENLTGLMSRLDMDLDGSQQAEITSILGNVVSMSRTQRGSRLLQHALEEQSAGDFTVTDSIYIELLEHFVPLMTDAYGNYVCQKLMRKCRPTQVHAIVQHIQYDLVELSQDPHGTRAVQCLITTLAMHDVLRDIQLVIDALEKNCLALVHSSHGNHVIQACLTNFSCTANNFIHETILNNFIHVANNRYGCCVLQCGLKRANYEQYQQLLSSLVEHTLVLVKDPYGNYAVQFILDRGDPQMYIQMFNRMRGHVAQLSMQKFSSNVIEKGLRGEPEYAECASLIVMELAVTDKAKALLHSPYGNYVIQKALTVPHWSTLQLASTIRPHLPALRSTPYGKKLEKLVKRTRLAAEIGQANVFDVDCAPGHPWAPSSMAPGLNPQQMQQHHHTQLMQQQQHHQQILMQQQQQIMQQQQMMQQQQQQHQRQMMQHQQALLQQQNKSAHAAMLPATLPSVPVSTNLDSSAIPASAGPTSTLLPPNSAATAPPIAMLATPATAAITYSPPVAVAQPQPQLQSVYQPQQSTDINRSIGAGFQVPRTEGDYDSLAPSCPSTLVPTLPCSSAPSEATPVGISGTAMLFDPYGADAAFTDTIRSELQRLTVSWPPGGEVWGNDGKKLSDLPWQVDDSKLPEIQSAMAAVADDAEPWSLLDVTDGTEESEDDPLLLVQDLVKELQVEEET